jgi:hypothetical protein
MNLTKAIICDIDGVLADHRHRLHFVLKDGDYPKKDDAHLINKIVSPEKWKPDWDAFYFAMDKDGVNEWCKSIIKDTVSNLSYFTNMSILFVTGRPERYAQMTVDWLVKNNIISPHWLHIDDDRAKLFMRPDYTTEAAVPEGYHEIYNGNVAIGYRHVSDHRPSHIVKKEIYEREIKGKYDVLFVLEDDEECCKMYKDLGLTVLQVK